MKSTNIKLLFTVLLSVVCLTAVFSIPGTTALADEGENVTDNTTTYYSANGTVLDDPFNADLCYDAEGNVIPCPVPDENEDEVSDNGTDRGPKSLPPGQLVRRGLTGPIIEVGDGYFVVETNFGAVKVYTTENVSESMIGQRVAVKLSNRERTSNTSDNVSDNSSSNQTQYYRQADADQFKIIPTKATKQHKWGTVESTDEGCFFVDDSGNQTPVECDNTSNMVGLFGTSGNESGNQSALLGTENTLKIQNRIQARIDKAEASGDQKTLNRLQAQLSRFEQKAQERELKKEARISARASKATGKPEDKGNSGNNQSGDKGNQGNAGGNNNKDK